MGDAHTISEGLVLFSGKAKFHRDQAEKYERMVEAMEEANRLLDGDGVAVTARRRDLERSRSKPADLDEIRAMIDSMPAEFTHREFKSKFPKMSGDAFKRAFRAVRQEGRFIVVQLPNGRRDGIYRKHHLLTTAAQKNQEQETV